MVTKEQKEIRALRKAYSSLIDLIYKKSKLKNLPYIILCKEEISKIQKIHNKLRKELGIK